MLPNMIFFTGVPGSRWSGIAKEIKSSGQYDCTDRAAHREYKHHDKIGPGTKLLMSHEWPYHFDNIMERYPDAWIQLVYRPDWASFLWWKQAGGFNITYPNYDWYETDYLMTNRIQEQNELILDFGQKHSVQWLQHYKHSDIFIGTYKP